MLEAFDVEVRFAGLAAVDGVDLAVAPGETVAILGPSGCGKTTLLRALAGLEPLTRGRVLWAGEDLDGVAVHRRGFGLMFQDYALFPHRDVFGNVEFGLRMAGVAAGERARRVGEVLELVGLSGFEHRRVAGLSGGEQQRVALARTLARRPRLVMLDEPFGALDRPRREELLVEVRDLLALSGLPAIYVTHDHQEAFALANRVAVMRGGRVVQAGTPVQLWERPVDEWTARFLGFAAAVDVSTRNGVATTPWGAVPVPAGTPDGEGRLVMRPEAVVIDADGPVRGLVGGRTFEGDRVVLEVAVDGTPPLKLLAPARGAPRRGEPIAVRIDGGALLVYPRAAPGRPTG